MHDSSMLKNGPFDKKGGIDNIPFKPALLAKGQRHTLPCRHRDKAA
jgi:hypothetical protein